MQKRVKNATGSPRNAKKGHEAPLFLRFGGCRLAFVHVFAFCVFALSNVSYLLHFGFLHFCMFLHFALLQSEWGCLGVVHTRPMAKRTPSMTVAGNSGSPVKMRALSAKWAAKKTPSPTKKVGKPESPAKTVVPRAKSMAKKTPSPSPKKSSKPGSSPKVKSKAERVRDLLS